MIRRLKDTRIVLVMLYVVAFYSARAQKNYADSLKSVLPFAISDTEKVKILNKIANYYLVRTAYEMGLPYARTALKLAEHTGQPKRIAYQQTVIVAFLGGVKNTDSALNYGKQAQKYYDANTDKKAQLLLHNNMAVTYDASQQITAAIDEYAKVLSLAGELRDSATLHDTYNSTGRIYDNNGEYDLAIQYYNKALAVSAARKKYMDVIGDYVEIGNIHGRQGISPTALQAYFSALKVNEENVKLDRAEAIIYVNIGNIYNGLQHDTLSAMKYYRNALKSFEKANDKAHLAVLLGNIGNIYMEAGDYKKAEYYELLSRDKLIELKDAQNMAICYINLGEFYTKVKDYPQALDYYNKGFELQEQSGFTEGQCYTLSGLCTLYSLMGNDKKAEECGEAGFTIARNTNLIRGIKDLGKILSDLYEKDKQPAKALYYFKQYQVAKDSMDNKEASKKLIQSELNYEYAQKQQEDKLKEEKKDALNAEMARHEKVIRNVYLGGFFIVLLLTILILRNFIRVRKANKVITEQKAEVEEQKSIVEQKNRDITDSINYAKRIQHAMLPTIQTWNNFFKKSFIYYKPKDIVSGDFYWCMAVGKDVIVAVADCTGHGVPGAFMSMLGISSLNKIVGEKEITQPGKILNMLRDEIIKSLNPEGKMEELQDGMDMTLCYISAEKGTLEYAAANNPLCIVRKNEDKTELIELDADKMPVGKYLEEGAQFSSHKVEIKKGDRIYLFTDGYADQFGGERGKKFKYKQLLEMLLGSQDKNMNEQKELFDKAMTAWKGNLEQVDDILVAGIEIV